MGNLVSVVIPVYNRASLIVDALNSVLAQTYRPLEIIVVDDGSTDRTPDVVQHWIETVCTNKKAIMARLIRQEKKGGNAARNRGIKESMGEFVAFLDSDDIWLPRKLEKQIPHFSDPEIGAVYCGLQQVDLATGKVWPVCPRKYPSGWLLRQLLIKDVTAPTSTFVIRKEVFSKVGTFDERLLARQDWDMWIRIAAVYKIGVVPEVLVHYRHHLGERTASNPEKEIRAYHIIRGKYQSLLSQQPLRIRQAARASFYKRLGRVYFHRRGRRAQALLHYLFALFNYPFDFDTWAATAGVFLPKTLRQKIRLWWNSILGGTGLEIRSH